MSIRVLDPTYGEEPPASPLAPRIESLRGATVGLLSNGKTGTGGLFDHLERILLEEWGVASVVRRTKANYSAPAETELMAEAAHWAVLFAGIGD